ncbi:unnamed protein product [Caenorhabditis nigoni]
MECMFFRTTIDLDGVSYFFIYEPTFTYLYYVQNPTVSGKQILTLPQFVTPVDHSPITTVYAEFTVQSHKLTEDVNDVWLSVYNGIDRPLNVNCDLFLLSNDTHCYGTALFSTNKTFHVVLNVDYSSDDLQHIEVRIWTSTAPANWLDYSN